MTWQPCDLDVLHAQVVELFLAREQRGGDERCALGLKLSPSSWAALTIILSPSLNILVFLLNFAIFSAPRVVPSAPVKMSMTASACVAAGTCAPSVSSRSRDDLRRLRREKSGGKEWLWGLKGKYEGGRPPPLHWHTAGQVLFF